MFVILALGLIVSSSLCMVPQRVAAQDQYYNKSFAWDYEGRHWTWNLSIPMALYDAYKAVPVSTRTHNGPSGYGYLTTTQDYYMRLLAQKLNNTTTQLEYNSFDQVSFVLAFVQSLPYTSDNVTEGYNEYPRFPIETLVDGGGDCEDTSILFATITLIMGYGTVYINPPDHYAVGVLGNDLHGTYWEYPKGSNRTYYYCETTGDGFTIGQLPEEFSGQSAYIYSIDESKQFIPNVEITNPIEPTPEPTDSPISTSPTPQQTSDPTPHGSAGPTVAQPTVQPVLPLSFNLISEEPLLFAIIIAAITVSIIVAVWSVRKPKGQSPTPTKETKQESKEKLTDLEETGENEQEAKKFCIFCGSQNKSYAVYCEGCGKQIA